MPSCAQASDLQNGEMMHLCVFKSEEELKSLLLKVKESEKVGLKLNIQETKIMASSPITSWQIDGETMETLRDFILGAPKSLPEKALAAHSSTFAWKIPWMEEPGRLQSMGLLESDTTEQVHFHFSLSCIGEGNGNPLQCSCLENPRDGGAW